MVLFALSTTIALSVIASLLMGLGMTPMFINAYVLVSDVAEERDHTELNAALGSSFNLGDGLATLALGMMIGLFTSTVAVLLGTIVVFCLCASSMLLTRRGVAAAIPEEVV